MRVYSVRVQGACEVSVTPLRDGPNLRPAGPLSLHLRYAKQHCFHRELHSRAIPTLAAELGSTPGSTQSRFERTPLRKLRVCRRFEDLNLLVLVRVPAVNTFLC